jgi:hypothetical protein
MIRGVSRPNLRRCVPPTAVLTPAGGSRTAPPRMAAAGTAAAARWILGLGLAGLLSCSPEYQSGVTACAASGPACPDGFVCVGIRCYREGEQPIGGAGGAGGGSGGNASDARTTGTGGTGGMAGPPDAAASDAALLTCTNPMQLTSCPPMGDIPATCSGTGNDCSTRTRCGMSIYSCPTGRRVNCAYEISICSPVGDRCDNPMFPDFCPGRGVVGPSCYSAGVDCTTITVCGDERVSSACFKGAVVDCTRPTAQRCVRVGTADGSAPDGSSADAGARDSGLGPG